MPKTLCSQCGAPLDSNFPDAPCSACLLEFAVETETMPPSNISAEIEIEMLRQVAFPQLEIIEQIGRGGMGTVYKARQPKLDRFVALKVMPEDRAAHPSFAERFAREGKLLARLSHPNIVAVYDFGQTEVTIPGEEKPVKFFYLTMEYVDGVDLRHAMREERFSPEQALAIVPKICDALQYAHEEGVLHRDIKPENILLDTKGRVKIADFGISKLNVPNEIKAPSVSEERSAQEPTDLTQTGQIVGTPNYMAPEQFEAADQVDPRADIYSLGVVFYELLTGELPKNDFPRPSEKIAVGAEIDHIVQKALEKNRENRYQSAEEFKTEVYHTTYVLNHREKTLSPSEDRKPFSFSFFARLIFAFVIVCMSSFVFHAMSTLKDQRTGDYVFSLSVSFFASVIAAILAGFTTAFLVRLLGERHFKKMNEEKSLLHERRRTLLFLFIIIAGALILMTFFALNDPPSGRRASWGPVDEGVSATSVESDTVQNISVDAEFLYESRRRMTMAWLVVIALVAIIIVQYVRQRRLKR